MYVLCNKFIRMDSKLKRKKKLNKNREGFTLVEAVVSIAIFGLITIFMTNFIMSVVKFSVDNEKRADMMIDLDRAATTIKNELRTASEINIYEVGAGTNRCINFKKGDETYNIVRENIGGNDNRDRLVLSNLGNGGSGCGISSTNRRNLNDNSIVSILDFDIDSEATTFSDGSISNNHIVYVRIMACDSDDYQTEDKIFSCDDTQNPYVYIFGITTKNLNPIVR